MVFPNETILKSFVENILKEGVSNNLSLNEEFVAFYLKLASLNPENGKNFMKRASKYDVKLFIDSSLDKLSDETDPSILMLKMQFHFEKDYDSLDNLAMKNQVNIDKRTQPLLTEIIQAKPNSKEEFEKLLRRISIYLVLKSGLGNPGNIQVLREGTAALNSIFNIDDLKNFVEQRNQDKEKQLSELLSVVSGIRIFNKDCGKGGDSIPELVINLSEATEATNLALSHCLIRIMERVNLLTTSIDSYIMINPETQNVEITIPKNKNVNKDGYNKLCKILSVYRQYEILVRKLISDIDQVQMSNKEISTSFSTQLNDLHSLVRYRTAIPTDQVFPYFVQLWYHWRKMQSNMFLISAINNIMWNLDTAHEKMEVPHSIIDTLLDGRRIESDAQRIQRTEDCKIEHTFTKCQIVFLSENITDDIILQYLGFCSLCICMGALIPANPNMGLYKWGNKYYAFCTPEHAKQFGSNPNRCLKESLEYSRSNIEMINLLQIYDEVYAVRQMTTLIIKHQNIVKMEDKGVQTELHPIPSHIDVNYIWNIWDYKKKVCQMANLMNRKTHSTQTYFSASKVENSCQTSSFMLKKTEET